MSHRARRIALIAVVLSVVVPALAAAQASPPPAPQPPSSPVTPPPATTVRSGLMFGVGVGVGSLVADCDDCRATFEAGGISGHVGWMITPRLALMLDVWGMAHREVFLLVYQNINTLAARYWFTPRFWAAGGIGNANAGYQWDGIFVDREDRTEKTGGVMVGAGYELMIRDNFAIDLEFRYGTGFYDEQVGDDYVIEGHNVSIGAGFNWY